MSPLDATGARRALGMALVLASALFFGLAGVFTKTTTADVWTIACWRGLVGGLIIAAYVVLRGRSAGGPRRFALGWRGWLLALVGGLSSIAFITAFKLTYVANVAIIYATVPFMAALLEWAALGERVRLRTIAAACASLAGVAVMLLGGFGTGSLAGDAVALLMTFGCAVYLVMIRAFRETPVVWAGAVAAFMVFGAGLLVVDPLAVSGRDAIVMSLFGLSFAFAVILWTEGAKLIPAAESGLLGSAEVPLAIFFSWLILSELPPPASFAGGTIVLLAVVLYARQDMRAAGRGIRAQSAAPAE